MKKPAAPPAFLVLLALVALACLWKHRGGREGLVGFVTPGQVPPYLVVNNRCNGSFPDKCVMTTYESYPASGTAECDGPAEGCKYRGLFKLYGDRVMPAKWVQTRNIVAVHSSLWSALKGKWIRICYTDNRGSSRVLDARVIDMCGHGDCDQNHAAAKRQGRTLIDLEKHTALRLGAPPGAVNSNSFMGYAVFRVLRPKEVTFLGGLNPKIKEDIHYSNPNLVTLK